MAGNIQNVSFTSPAGIIAPDLIAEQQQVARNQQLAELLRQRSLTPIDPGKGAISPFQGASQLLNAWASKRIYKKTDAQQADMSRQYSAAIRSMLQGGAPTETIAATGTPQTGPSPQGYAQALRGKYGSGGVEDDGTLQPQNSNQPSWSEAVASLNGQPGPSGQGDDAPPQATPQTGVAPYSRGPLSLTGDTNRDMAMYAMAPDEYMKGVIGAQAPTDFTRQLQQAGIDPNSPMGRQLMQMNVAKQNYVAPVNGRPGSTIRDPYDPSKVIGYDAPNIDGAMPIYGPNGMPQGYQQLPGGTQAIAAASGAKTAGQNANEPITGYDANGNPVFGNKLDAAHGGGANFRPELAPGTPQFLGGLGTHGSDYFASLQEKAQPIANQVYALKQMVNLANGPTVYGPGSEAAVQTAGILNKVGQAFGVPGSFNDANVTNQQEMNKWAGQVAANAATAMGLNGSDARFNIALESNPSGHLTNAAIKQVGTQVIGLAQATAGMAQAGARYAQANPGPNAQAQFQSLWNRIYDPSIYTHMAQGPQAFGAWAKTLKPAEAAQVRQKYISLQQLGALPQ